MEVFNYLKRKSAIYQAFFSQKMLTLLAFIVAATVIFGLLIAGFRGGEATAQPRQRIEVTRQDRFGRMFRNLPPFSPANDRVREALMELGRAGGILDANDNLAAGPEALITDLSLSANNPNSPTQTAGTTFFGQFLDHDMTFDISSRLGTPTPPSSTTNVRTPAFDLDTVYGLGPLASPTIYDPQDPIKLKLENGGLFEDVPRDANNRAVIADPRNDQHMIISGLLTAISSFHNQAVDRVRFQDPAISDEDAFAKARQMTTWHYQWVILNEWLPQVIGRTMVNDILENGRKFYTPLTDREFIPVEFQVAFRFGHTQVRPSYRANLAGDNGRPFFGAILSASPNGTPNPNDPDDLRGGRRAPRRFIGWQTFFDFGDTQVRPNKLTDTKISSALLTLPLEAIPGGTPPTSLLQRNLLRHLTFQLPSGQDIARTIGAPVLSSNDLAELRSIFPSFDTSTPLWYYILKEAEVMERGINLGPVGGRIVGEVIIGLLQIDEESYLNANPAWIPTLPTRAGGPRGFRMIDFLTFAGVDPTSRGQ